MPNQVAPFLVLSPCTPVTPALAGTPLAAGEIPGVRQGEPPSPQLRLQLSPALGPLP